MKRAQTLFILVFGILFAFTACGQTGSDKKLAWKDYSSYISMEADQALAQLEKDGLTLVQQDDSDTLYVCKEKEVLYDHEFELSFSIDSTNNVLTSYSKLYAGSKNDEQFLMDVFEFLVETYGVPGNPFVMKDYGDWESFYQMLKSGSGQSILTDEDGQYYETFGLWWMDAHMYMGIDYYYKDQGQVRLKIIYYEENRWNQLLGIS